MFGEQRFQEWSKTQLGWLVPASPLAAWPCIREEVISGLEQLQLEGKA